MLRDPELKPDVPSYAEKLNITRHIRYQYLPTMYNALGNPDVNGPRVLLSIDLMCPICEHIQPLGPPGVDHKCRECDLNYKYTAAKANTWLWIWRSQPKLVIEGSS
jgi:hypothetical protein